MSANKATAVDFERGATESVWAELEALRASNAELLDLAIQFKATVQFYIGIDERKGDDEGAALKRFTLMRIEAALSKAEPT